MARPRRIDKALVAKARQVVARTAEHRDRRAARLCHHGIPGPGDQEKAIAPVPGRHRVVAGSAVEQVAAIHAVDVVVAAFAGNPAAAAKKLKIPYQIESGLLGSTDAARISMTRQGIPSGNVSIATRYIHSPVGMLSLKDIENSAKLTTASIQNATKYF